MNCGENKESNVDFHIQDEAERLLNEIELMIKNVEDSELYAGMRFELERNETIQNHLFRLLGSHSHVQVVIYALGSMEYSFHSQFQLAVVLLLKRDFSNWIGNIEVYDPGFSSADIIVLKELGFEILNIDENCKRQVQRPTMFYMPVPSYCLIGNLLGANWSSSCINQIFLLTNSFRDALTTISPCSLNRETVQRLERIIPFTTEVDIKTSYAEIYTNVFSKFAWHFFDVDPIIDMETSLPVTEIIVYKRNDKEDCSWLDMQRYLEENILEDMQIDISSEGWAQFFGEYRRPRRLRCNSVPPPPGWIKLNIYGIGKAGDQQGRYSGVFQDETGMLLGSYSGTIHVEENAIAGLEALREGLVKCVEGNPNAQKLIVESDNVILVQYVNGHPEPNEMTMCRLKEIFDLLERITCAVYHVYEEANEAARDLALRDERHNCA
ncbi:protein SENSITIVITY TO RED LIGHT REDUCED 1-like [Nicotiana tomentosiformis]|uniref:protein SENSITIVITY TO RED LIGHT REDUCED 1-like n=1 Tax=Nicotiana tomentosiformis TaxID=4098 RepID=UPI00051BA755|nr:protein SENSITIVITY TO RED LIGHT REDUCED 1-like isoform X2 [Nicotiana tomentosiformis]